MKPARERVPCEVCGKLCSPGAGLASHTRAAHPAPVRPVAAPVDVEVPDADRLVPDVPEGLSERSRTLWRSIVNVYDLRGDELRILEDACREAMLIDRLDRELEAGAPLTVKGSMGQTVASPILTEIRQHRSTLAALFAKLTLPDDEVSPDGMATRSTKARAAANARWRRGA